MKVILAAALCVALFADEKPEVGKVVADIKMKPMDGKEIKLGDFRADKEKKAEGAITVVYFWSYKCPTGKPVIPAVKDFQEKVAGEKSGVKLICIASYGESADDVTTYAKDNSIVHTFCHDGDKTLAKAFGAKQVNTTYVMDKDGKLCYRGGFEGNAEAAVKAIKEGKEAPKSDGKFKG